MCCVYINTYACIFSLLRMSLSYLICLGEPLEVPWYLPERKREKWEKVKLRWKKQRWTQVTKSCSVIQQQSHFCFIDRPPRGHLPSGAHCTQKWQALSLIIKLCSDWLSATQFHRVYVQMLLLVCWENKKLFLQSTTSYYKEHFCGRNTCRYWNWQLSGINSALFELSNSPK